MANFTQFIRNIQRRGGQVEDGVDRIVKAAALEIDAAVVQATPVDTGRARSNWIVQINRAATGQVTSSSFDRSGQGAITQGMGVIRSFNVRNDSSIHITNNTPYIGDLNNGTSAQAPANFVQQAVSNGAAAVRGSRLFN